MQGWNPDTCRCKLATNGESIAVLCSRHAHMQKDAAILFVRAQNKDKNIAVTVVAAEFGRNPEEIEIYMEADEVELVLPPGEHGRAIAALAQAGSNAKVRNPNANGNGK